MNNQDKMTLPAMPAAFKKTHRPTLVMKTSVEVKEERENELRERGRYSIIVPRGN